MGLKSTNPWKALRYVLLTLVCYAVFLPVVLPLVLTSPTQVTVVAWVMIVASAIANLGVLSYHYLSPPHPKFTCIPWRRRVFRLHMLSGTIELLASGVAFYYGGAMLLGYTIALSALLFHVPSAYLLTPTVFGARAIMWPGYLLCIGLHGFCAAMLLTQPSSLYWVAATFLVLNVYVWVRVYYYILSLIGLFPESQYSAAILLAEATVLPVVFGPITPFLILVACLTYFIGYRVLFGAEDLKNFVRERPLEGVYLRGVQELWDQLNNRDDYSSLTTFVKLIGEDSHIELEKLDKLMRSAGIPRDAYEEFLRRVADDDGTLSFDAFDKYVWSMREFRDAAHCQILATKERSEREKAAFIFELLDLDENGLLGPIEILQMIYAWGCPASDAEGLSKGNQSVDTETFFRSFQPVWRFLYREVVEAKFDQRSSHLSRLFKSRKGAIYKEQTKLRLKRVLSTMQSRSTSSELNGGKTSDDFNQLVGSDLKTVIRDICESSVLCRFDDGETVVSNFKSSQDVWFVLGGGVNVVNSHDQRACFELGQWVRREREKDGFPNASEYDWDSAVAVGKTSLLRFDPSVFSEFMLRNPFLDQHQSTLCLDGRTNRREDSTSFGHPHTPSSKVVP